MQESSLIRLIDTLISVICRVCGLLAALAILILTGLVIASIASRAMGIYVAGLTDFAAYSLAWAGSMGMAYTFGQHAHIRVDVFVNQLRGKTRYVCELTTLIFATAMTSYLSWFLIKMTYTSWEYKDRSDGSDEILIWIPQVPFTLGFSLFAMVLILAVLRALLQGNLEGLAATQKSEDWK